MTMIEQRRLRATNLAGWLILLCVFLMPAFALAAGDVVTPGPAVTGLQSLEQAVMAILVPVVVAAASSLGLWIMNKLRQKLHLQVSDAQISQWNAILQHAVLRGAEYARNEADKLVEGKKVPGGQVMDAAVAFAVAAAESAGLPEKARSEIEGWIEGHLNATRREQALQVAATVAVGDPYKVAAAGASPATV